MSEAEVQRTFAGLLARPLVTPESAPDLHRSITANHREVAGAAAQLGYRLTRVGRVHRLVRQPLAGTVTTPPAPLDAPPRRVLALVCVLAAACEDTNGSVTLAKLSDLVAAITAADTSTTSAYEPLRLTHRRDLLTAARQLEHWGVLRRRQLDDTLVEEWAGGGTGIGAGYDVDRDALLLLAAPDILGDVLHPPEVDPSEVTSTVVLRALRGLVETPAVLYSELDPIEAETLRTTRGLRATTVRNLLGGSIEARSEGLVLIQPSEPPCPITVDWPRSETGAWVALLMADIAGTIGTRQDDGTVVLTNEQVEHCARTVHGQRLTYLTKKLQEDPAAVRSAAERELLHLALVRTTPEGGWALSPVAARYRNPDVILGGTAAPSADDARGAEPIIPSAVSSDEDLEGTPR